MLNHSYRGNPLLKKINHPIAWSSERIKEFVKCSKDPEYFATTYMKIISLDQGLVPFNMYDRQRDMLNLMHENQHVIITASRQIGKSTTTCAYILWYIIFNQDKTVALLANKADTAQELLGKVQLAYQHLPDWLQQGVVEWNKRSFVLENNSRIIAAATSSDNIRGFSINLLFLDECAFIEGWEKFSASVLPTVSSGKTTKIIMVSTPNGLNHFWQTWSNSIKEKNDYAHIKIMWNEIPGRDEVWVQKVKSDLNFDEEKWNQEYCCEFMGSSGTLIAGWKLKQLTPAIPGYEKDGLRQYTNPIPKHTYALVADTSEGKGLDYSSFSVIDITKMPFVQVCTYYNNMVVPSEFAQTIHQVANHYNKAVVLVESNNISGQVADMMYNDYEYENLMYTENGGRNGKRLTNRFGPGVERGIRTTKTTKAIGCSMLKLLIEQNQLIIQDYHTIYELSRFSRKANSYQAEEGHHDDLVMCLVLFAWMSEQPLFKDLNDINTLNKLRDITEEQMAEQLAPFGFLDDGDPDTTQTEEWQVVSEFPGFFLE